MKKQAPLVLPALRGSIGNWIYYSCLMTFSEISSRVKYAEEIHPDKALSQLIQRSLEGTRAKHIASYLASTKERFFNSLVLATYGGSPNWLEVGNFRSTTSQEVVKLISENAMDSLGFLSLSGTEKIFAIDGQHRLAGIKRAMEDGLELALEQVPVILVGHKKDAAGLQRTRRLFTTLNKTAIPVRKRDIIALDEDDVMAITARRLVETNPAFRDPKIAVIASQNIPAANRVCFTTISSLYDVLRHLFLFDLKQSTDRSLRFNRPPDDRLEHYYQVAVSYFSIVGKTFKPVGDLFATVDPASITELQRGSHGGHLLFRQIGIDIFTRTAVELAMSRGIGLSEAVTLLKKLPTDIADAPYRYVIWNPDRHTIIVTGKTLAHDIVRYMAGLYVNQDELLEKYRGALGTQNENKYSLPIRLI